ncbi:chitobiase/beta-hexosaminidase C-terminal domain-containing protein [Flagellimonas pacifica]|uniref:chitobiase/beta-hexosaminidase C-terminal domain-containing protein n=1 Tax=Flagellimonas pacifica TaxID=1247520 RepID=UPI0013FDA44C|nr:chitobiase/beta-hexosaminidase C-terminal domain-containing protein [Allomuricauda parva]
MSADTIQLATPKIEADSILFKNSASVKIDLAYEGVTIRYTLDGSSVTSNSLIYETPLTINSNAQLKVKAFHSDFKPSEELGMVIRKMKKDISKTEISVDPEPNQNYYGNGAKTLIDGQKGTVAYRNGNKWLGFQSKNVEVYLKFPEPIALEKIMLSALQDQGAWIFMPRSITINAEGNPVGAIEVKNSANTDRVKMNFIEIPLKKRKYKELTITITSLDEIPEWHQGKGTLPWSFLDEILVE